MIDPFFLITGNRFGIFENDLQPQGYFNPMKKTELMYGRPINETHLNYCKCQVGYVEDKHENKIVDKVIYMSIKFERSTK